MELKELFLCQRLSQKELNKESKIILQGVSEKILELFSFEKRLGFKMNYLKRQGHGSGATGPTHWEKWARRWAEMKKK
jgi:hypothetical protein